MAISDLCKVIEDRVVLNRPGVEAQAHVLGVTSRLIITIGCVVDPTLITDEMLDDIIAFNDEALNTITFIDGRLVQVGADNALFMLTFESEKCNGSL